MSLISIEELSEYINEFKNNLQAESSDDDDGDDDGSEEQRVRKGHSNAFAALSLDGDE